MQNVTEELRTALIDRYVIESELGEGGMATVYLAHDTKHNRKVALKVMKPELAAAAPAHSAAARLGRSPGIPVLRHALRRGRDAARQAGS